MTTPTTTSTRSGPDGPARRRARRGRRLLAVSALALAPLAAACGGDDSSASGEAAAATNTDMTEYTQCLADNGVDMPDPGSGGQPPQAGSDTEGGTPPEMPDQEAMQAAQEACADLAPEGGVPGPGSGGGGDSAEMQAYTDCLAENGVEVPEIGGGQPPTSGDTGDAATGSAPPADGAPFGLDSSDPTVAAAIEACSDLEPERPAAPPSDQGSSTTEAATTS